MLKPYLNNGEFIHSFIFRMQNAVGIKDYSNLVSNSGRWKEYVYIKPDTKFIFQNHTEKDFVQLLRNTGFDKKYSPPERKQEMSKPSKYLEDVNSLISPISKPFGVKLPNYISREVRYCEHCILDMVNEFGTAFFIGDWQVGKLCNIHQTPLNRLTTSSQKTSVESIKTLICGNRPKEHEQLNVTKEDSFMSPSIYN